MHLNHEGVTRRLSQNLLENPDVERPNLCLTRFVFEPRWADGSLCTSYCVHCTVVSLQDHRMSKPHDLHSLTLTLAYGGAWWPSG